MTEKLNRDYRTDYDTNDPELATHWDEVIADLHTDCPVAHSTKGDGGYWVLTRQKEIKEAAGDWETYVSGQGVILDRPEEMPYIIPEESDPPLHTGLRKALNPFLAPGVVRNYEEPVRQHALDLLADFEGSSTVEAVRKYSNPLPGRSFCVTVAGIPQEDIEYLQERFEVGIVGAIELRAGAMADAANYLAQYLERRAGEPDRGDVINAILTMEVDGVGWAERVQTLTTLTLGGVGTTGFTIAASLHYLATHPEQRRRLVEHPELWPNAVEEFLRFYAAAPHNGRRTTCPVEIGGVSIDKGEQVVLNYGAGSRDPEVFEDPYEIQVDRELPNRHLSFGYGIHRCVGSHLARLELRVALEEFLRRYPDFSVPEGFVPEYQINDTVTIQSLPLVLG